MQELRPARFPVFPKGSERFEVFGGLPAASVFADFGLIFSVF